jgi:hypothetical protein
LTLDSLIAQPVEREILAQGSDKGLRRDQGIH